ncbi:hydroxymethylbilane synthase [Rapidithrix thailandica]|uniref:Hydroxymethylbilane synthase n=1 Tax=Rapidithrix thailandica TaxID=413964 RepID=A0AAW9SCV0_9BACT
MRTVKIGTRGSKLALWQAEYVEELLKAQGLTTEIVIIETKGDKILDKAISKIGSKGLFTEELEDQLRDGSIDIAVHSAKDVQSSLPDDLHLIAFTQREIVNDVLLSDSALDFDKQENIVIGTSSVRRIAMLKHHYPKAQAVNVRGNLQTRLQKMQEGHCDALLLAYAGVHRMRYDDKIVYRFPTEKFTPAVGQGTVAVEASRNMETGLAQAIKAAINDPETEYCLLAERAYLRTLEGGCSIPAFGLATYSDGMVNFTAGIIEVDGSHEVRKTMQATPEGAEQMGDEMAAWVLNHGGKEILAKIRQQ